MNLRGTPLSKIHRSTPPPRGLGPGSTSGAKGEKNRRGQTKIGEQSEPRGSPLREKGWQRPRHPFSLPREPLGSLRSPIFFLFNPVFCLPPPPRILIPRYHSVKGCRFCATWMCKGPIFFSHLTIRTYPRASHSYFILLLTISYNPNPNPFFTRFFPMYLMLVT